MCGITGFVGFEDINLLKDMTQTLQHRGPDEKAHYISKTCSLGHRRLITIDPTKGLYPIHNENNDIFVIHNGDIYNYKELNKELEAKGHRFYSNCDGETVVHAYEEWGVDCFSKFNGMFAIAIWDDIKKKLILARDPVGIKPLYFAHIENKFLFASEIKALLKSNLIKKEIDRQALSNYLFFQYVLEPRTIFTQVKKLYPGHYLVFDGKKTVIKKYFDINLKVKTGSENHFINQLDIEITKAVQSRTIADVPLGCFLSGGVDSSTVTATLSKFSDNLNTFSIGFEETEFDESRYARKVSETFGTNHHEQIVTSEDMLKTWPKIIEEFDEPFADSSAIPTYLVSKLARKHVTISLSGDGGDELFCGYDRYFYSNTARKLSFLSKLAKPVSGLFPEKIQRFVSYSVKQDPERYIQFVNVIPNSEKLFAGNIEQSEQYWIKNLDYFKQMQYYDLKTYLPGDILTKVDRCTMANSLMGRVPLLDKNILNLAFSIPTKYTANDTDLKILLKKVALRKGVPKEVIYRKKKGFAMPINNWMANELKSEIEETLFEKDDYLNQDYVVRLWNKYLRNNQRYSHAVWTILMFKTWKKKYYD